MQESILVSILKLLTLEQALYELMWDNEPTRLIQRFMYQEIHQIWVYLPSDQRMLNISVDLLYRQNNNANVAEKKGTDL